MNDRTTRGDTRSVPSARKFRCGPYLLVARGWLLIAVGITIASSVAAVKGDSGERLVFLALVGGFGVAVSVLTWILRFWYFEIDPAARVVSIRHGRHLRRVPFDEVVDVEIPSIPHAMPRNVTLLLTDGTRLFCPLLSQGGIVRPSGLNRLTAYLFRVGLASTSVEPPVNSFLPRIPRALRGQREVRS